MANIIQTLYWCKIIAGNEEELSTLIKDMNQEFMDLFIQNCR
jgi:hypothetical protein